MKIKTEITPYCKYILISGSMFRLLRMVKLINADDTAPKEDIKTKIAAQVPLLAGLT